MPVPSSQKTRMGFLVPGVAIPRVVTGSADLPMEGGGRIPSGPLCRAS